MPANSEDACARKRAHDAAVKRSQRAVMTPTERAAARAENDRLYRERHAAELLAYGRARSRRLAEVRWAKGGRRNVFD